MREFRDFWLQKCGVKGVARLRQRGSGQRRKHLRRSVGWRRLAAALLWAASGFRDGFPKGLTT